MKAPPPPRVPRPVMFHQWTRQTFLHWAYPPEVVQRHLPPGLEVETFDGSAWIGLVPFLMQGVRPPGVPAMPWASRFPETNVRTYVRGPDGQSAIWFLSLDAARLGAVLGARATYWLPYFWSTMSVDDDSAQVRYRSRRRWPGPRGARCDATIEIGAPLDDRQLGPLDHFLTARHVLYIRVATRLAYTHAEHPPWPLARAEVIELDEDLLTAAGLQHQSERTEARRPRRRPRPSPSSPSGRRIHVSVRGVERPERGEAGGSQPRDWARRCVTSTSSVTNPIDEPMPRTPTRAPARSPPGEPTGLVDDLLRALSLTATDRYRSAHRSARPQSIIAAQHRGAGAR